MKRSTKKAGALSLVIALGTGLAALAGWALDNTDKSDDDVEEKKTEEKSEEKAIEDEELAEMAGEISDSEEND